MQTPLTSTPDSYANWKHWHPDAFLQCRPDKARYFDWHIKRATANRSVPLKILEIGFGNGEFLGWAKTCGHEVTGIELSGHLVRLAKAAGICAYRDVAELPAGMQFDVIVAFDVLEHIHSAQLESVLGQWRLRLADQGTMLFRFPNAESPLGNVYQNGDITHVNALGVSKILQLCELTQLTLLHHGEAVPLQALPLRSLPRAAMAATIRGALQWVLGSMLLGHAIRIAANEIVVLGMEPEV